MHKSLPFLFFFCCLFFFWEAMLLLHPTWHGIFPSPFRVFVRLYTGWDRFFFHSMATLQKILGGLALSLLVAFPLAWWMIQSAMVRIWVQPFVVLMQGMPMFAIAPLMVLLFDWSYTAVIIPTALMIFFPLTVSIYRGFASTPGALLDYFRIHNASSWQILFHLRLPWAMPQVCAGLRIAGAIAAMSAFTGEWAGAQEGLGVLMMESRRGSDLETAFAALFCLSAMSMTLYGCMAGFEAWILSRRTSSSKSKVNLFQRLRLKAVSATGICIAAFLLSGCGESPYKDSLRLMLDWNPNPNHIPFYVGIAKGFFQEAGIPLHILKLNDPADTFPYLSAGQADIGINYMPHFLRKYESHNDLVPIGYLVKKPLNCLLFPTHLGIKEIKDLNGKVFGHSTDQLIGRSLSLLLRNHEITPSAVHKVGFNLVAALASDRIDVLYGVYENIEREQLKAVNIEVDCFRMTDLGMPDYFELICLASRNNLMATPEKMQAFKRALQRSIDFSKEHPDEAFALYLAANPDKSDFAAMWERRAWEKTLPVLAKTQNDEPEVWDHFLVWLYENQLIQTPVRTTHIFSEL